MKLNRQFGNTDLQTSPVVYGCMGGAGAFGPQEEKDSIEALLGAYEAGVNFFDTAEMYGKGYSEQLLGKAFGEKRKDIIISSKVSPKNLSPEGIQTACERSLKNLGSDYLDLYLIHWPNRDIPLADSIGALKKLKEQGKIRYYGVSNFGKEDLTDALELGDISANQVPYHLFFRSIEFDVQLLCEKKKVPIMCYSSLMQGLLAGKYRSLADFPASRARTRMFDSRRWEQCAHKEHGAEEAGQKALDDIWKITSATGLRMEELAVGWLKAQKAVGGVIVGTRNAEQSKGLRNLLDIKLSPDVLAALTEATDELKKQLGADVDMWGKNRIR
ncbi:MAG: aldo/keto reductase [Spirochaetales bacterium]|nr:aldo/keto reductase [Spirochaetales bacterium]